MSTYANSTTNLTTCIVKPHPFKMWFYTTLAALIIALLTFQSAHAQSARTLAQSARTLAQSARTLAQSARTPAQPFNLKQALAEMSIGRPDAPVTLYEYSSLTCPHCARFYAKTLPLIEKNYVKTGKVRVVFRDFPLDGLATGALMIVRCSAPKRRVDFFGMLYDTQNDWARAKSPMTAIIALARFFGMHKSDINTCLSNQALLKAIQNNTKAAVKRYALDSTPSFVLNNKVVIVGDQSYDKFAAVLNKALVAKNIKSIQ